MSRDAKYAKVDSLRGAAPKKKAYPSSNPIADFILLSTRKFAIEYIKDGSWAFYYAKTFAVP